MQAGGGRDDLERTHMTPTPLTQANPLSTSTPASQTPALPILQFPARGGMQTYYRLQDAERASSSALHDEFYDIRGVLLTRATPVQHHPRLHAIAAADEHGLQRRIMAQLRGSRALAEAWDPPGPGAFFDWLDGSPGPEFTIRALGLDDVLDYSEPGHIPAERCNKHCNWVQRAFPVHGALRCCPP